MQISRGRGLSSNSIPKAEHFVSCDNDVDICGYFIYSSGSRIGASIINIRKAADRRFRVFQAQYSVGTEYICGGSHGGQTLDPIQVPTIALSLRFLIVSGRSSSLWELETPSALSKRKETVSATTREITASFHLSPRSLPAVPRRIQSIPL